MKTLAQHLCPEGKFSQLVADQLAYMLMEYAIEEYGLEKVTGRSIYRFGILSLNFMDRELNREEFTFESFFKLLYCEIDRRDGHSDTTYTVLIKEAMERPDNDVICLLSKFWEEVADELPVNADEVFHRGLAKYCLVNGVDYDKDAMYRAKEYMKKGKEPVSSEYAEYVGIIRRILNSCEKFRKDGVDKDYDLAREYLEHLPTDTKDQEEVYERLNELLSEWMKHGELLRVLDMNYDPM